MTIMRRTISILAFLLSLGCPAVLLTSCDNAKVGTSSGKKTVFHCPMHPTYLSEKPGSCPICGMDLVPVNDTDPKNKSTETGGVGVVHIDPAVVQNIGVKTEKAANHILVRSIRTSSSIVPDERRQSVVTTRVMGYVEKLFVSTTGAKVKKGQPLFSFFSPDLLGAQSEYLVAVSMARSRADSAQLMQSARSRLVNFGMSDVQIDQVTISGEPQRVINIEAPLDGIVAEKMIVAGQKIDAGMVLFRIVDYADVWAVANIYQQDIPFVKIGQTAVVSFDCYPGETFSGIVTYIASELDMASRTLALRVELKNTADQKLKPGLNATLVIQNSLDRPVLSVPEQSVIHAGLSTVVVVSKGGGAFVPRTVIVGQTAEGYTEVVSGLDEGEDVVVSSQFLIDSESNLKTAVMKMSGEPIDPPKKLPASPAGSSPSGERVKQSTKKTGVPKNEHATSDDYICPMDPDVHSNKPGKCPICKMDLVLKKMPQVAPVSPMYLCPMDADIVSDKPGNCPTCGMDLVLKK